MYKFTFQKMGYQASRIKRLEVENVRKWDSQLKLKKTEFSELLLFQVSVWYIRPRFMTISP